MAEDHFPQPNVKGKFREFSKIIRKTLKNAVHLMKNVTSKITWRRFYCSKWYFLCIKMLSKYVSTIFGRKNIFWPLTSEKIGGKTAKSWKMAIFWHKTNNKWKMESYMAVLSKQKTRTCQKTVFHQKLGCLKHFTRFYTCF